MKLPVQVTFRDMVPLPSLEEDLRRRAAKFDRWISDLMSCRIIVEAAGNRHHQGHRYQIKIDVRVPEAELAVTQQGDEDINIAVRDAFEAMDRQLEDYARRRRGAIKAHPAADLGSTDA
jgi:ribosome-associated translation inhibitor RaiA